MNEQTDGKEKQLDITKFASRLQEVARNAENRNVHDNEIAEKLGMDGNTFSKKKNGRQNWNITDLMNIAAVYHCSIDYLLGLSDVQPKKANAAPTVRDMCRMIADMIDNKIVKVTKGAHALTKSEVTNFIKYINANELPSDTFELLEYWDVPNAPMPTMPQYTIEFPLEFDDCVLNETPESCPHALAKYQINKFIKNYIAIKNSDLPNDTKQFCLDSLLGQTSDKPAEFLLPFNDEELPFS